MRFLKILFFAHCIPIAIIAELFVFECAEDYRFGFVVSQYNEFFSLSLYISKPEIRNKKDLNPKAAFLLFPKQLQAVRNASRSVLSWSLCVYTRPWGAPA